MYRDQAKRNLSSIMTSRPKNLKNLEDAYGIKYQPTSMKMTQKSAGKNGGSTASVSFKDRGDIDCSETLNTYRQNYNKYLITSSDRYAQPLVTTRRRNVTFHQNSASTSLLDERRAEVLSKQEQYFGKTDKATNCLTPKPSKSRSNHTHVSNDGLASIAVKGPPENPYKKENTFGDDDVVLVKKKPIEHHHHHYRHHQSSKSESKKQSEPAIDETDDTEEFIALIRHEIEKSVNKSISEKMNNTFQDLTKKFDRQALEIKKITNVVQKLHNSLNNKISHYGEENSRHFRYLCMKSEYDKMFYQHQNEVVSKSPPPTTPPTESSHEGLDKRSSKHRENCSLPSARTQVSQHQINPLDPIKKPVDDNMREMVAQLKKFCLHYESSQHMEDDFNNKSGVTSGSSGVRLNAVYQSCNHSFPEEGNFSSDEMTPRSTEKATLIMDAKCTPQDRPGNSLNVFAKNSGGGDD